MIQAAKERNLLTPNVVAAYAALHLVDDDKRPIRPASHHCLWLTLLCDERIKKLLLIAPPESAKTTWTISAYLGCRIGFYPESNTILGSSASATSVKRSLSLRTMTENKDWQATFPGVRRAAGMKWEYQEWSVAPDGEPTAGRIHPTMSAAGPDGTIEGARADLALADDLLDYDNSRTQHQRDHIENWTHSSFLSRLKSVTGRAVMIGTARHPGDVYNKARAAGGWVVCHLPLLSQSNEVRATLLYPDNWPYEMLGVPIANAKLPGS